MVRVVIAVLEPHTSTRSCSLCLRERQCLLDHIGQAHALLLKEPAVFGDVVPAGHVSRDHVEGGGADRRERRPQLVRQAGCELHLHFTERSHTLRVEQRKRNHSRQNDEQSEAHGQIRPADVRRILLANRPDTCQTAASRSRRLGLQGRRLRHPERVPRVPLDRRGAPAGAAARRGPEAKSESRSWRRKRTAEGP
jgi:hypothetical protein